MNTTVWEQIVLGARTNSVVRIIYTKVNGDTLTYYIEPYSVRDDKYLFGFNREKNHIEKYIMSNISDAEVTDQTFTPRWEVEITE